jgi:transcriptional regulator with XRE-family HTH domain
MNEPDPADDQLADDRLGAFIKSQRRLKALSQRELAKLTDLSDPYVSQIERGLHQPSIRVLKSLAKALNVQVETMLSYAGLLEARIGDETEAADTEVAIRTDPRLSDGQKDALLSVYRSYITANEAASPGVTR